MENTAKNTDRELWREREGDYYANSVSITDNGALAINVGGLVISKSLAAWHEQARSAALHESVVRHEPLMWGTNCLSAPDRGPHECAGSNGVCTKDGKHVCCRCGAFCLCPLCNEGNPRCQSSVLDAMIHTDTPVGRTKCINPPVPVPHNSEPVCAVIEAQPEPERGMATFDTPLTPSEAMVHILRPSAYQEAVELAGSLSLDLNGEDDEEYSNALEKLRDLIQFKRHHASPLPVREQTFEQWWQEYDRNWRWPNMRKFEPGTNEEMVAKEAALAAWNAAIAGKKEDSDAKPV